MELRQLKYLRTAVECGSLGKAAAQLGIATSGLSQRISRLESDTVDAPSGARRIGRDADGGRRRVLPASDARP
ncbi:LysR family transcriptional regulator [Mycoplana dimorpha]|uniref:LysR family transcriptional regulator n=1 Tax=Mycoplana dimorpha TaxID=28320 RepID=UPI001AED0E89